jgi:hypothetical protein
MTGDITVPSAGGELRPHHQRGLVKRYLYSRLWLRGDAFKVRGEGEAQFTDEVALWRALHGGQLWETARLRLEDFYLMDWLPLEPGLYYGPNAASAREHALHEVIERYGNALILSPHGKQSMVEGGIGCVRLASRPMFDDTYKLLTATSTGVAHQGFVVAVPMQMCSCTPMPTAIPNRARRRRARSWLIRVRPLECQA